MAITNKMSRYNNNKPQLSMVPASLYRATARALEYGAAKYARDDWRQGGDWTMLLDCLLRHIVDFTEGKDLDEESGLSVVDHIAANVAFLAEFVEKGMGNDNRWKPDSAE